MTGLNCVIVTDGRYVTGDVTDTAVKIVKMNCSLCYRAASSLYIRQK